LRFETKFDRWIVAMLAVAAFATLVLPWILPENSGRYHHPAPVWVKLLAWGIWAIALPCSLPQYYEVRDDGLFIRQGWRRVLIAFADLVEVQATSDTKSAAVFSADRVSVVTRDSRTFVIAPADQDAFFDALAQRCPQLSRKGFGLTVTISAPNT
jgi:hypothetical protein